MTILLTTDPEIPVPPEYYGGAERLASDLIEEYVRLGHSVILVAHPESSHPKVNQLYPWPAVRSTGAKNVLRNSLFLRKVYMKTKPDIIHSFSRLLYHYPLFFSKAKFVKRYGRLISRRSTRLAKLIFGRRLQLVAAAEHMLNHLNNKSAWKVIYNFVDTNYYKPGPEAERDGFAFIGRIEDIKGVHEAIQTALDLNENLIIAGNIEPEHQEYFMKQVEPHLNDKIQYVGIVNNHQKREILQQARATLFPIKWEEPFGIVMAESMACGTPVIGFRRGSVPEVIEDETSGFIVEDVAGMIMKAKNIAMISNDSVRKYATGKFSREHATLSYLDIFREMLL